MEINITAALIGGFIGALLGPIIYDALKRRK
jgi:hypothetical protein